MFAGNSTGSQYFGIFFLLGFVFLLFTEEYIAWTKSSSSSSNWILMSCQPHMVTSEQSNSGHKQIHISKLFSHIYQPSVRSIYKTNHFTNIKHTYKMYTNTNFWRVSPFNITPVKRAHKARTCWYRRPFRLIYQYQVKEKYKKGMDRYNIQLKNVI